MSRFYFPPYWCNSCDMSIALPPSPTPNSLLCPHCHLDSLEQLVYNQHIQFPSRNILPENDTPTASSSPASKSAIDSLPEVVIKIDDVEMCPICKDPFLDESVVKVMPCVHRFQSECIVQWLESKNTCPLCRFELPTVEEEGRGDDRNVIDDMESESDEEFDSFRVPALRTR